MKGLQGGISSLGVEVQNYGGGGEIEVRNFRFVPQKFVGVTLQFMIKITPPNGNCEQDAAGIGVADQFRHLILYHVPSFGSCSHSTPSSCCCAFSSNFCVAMAEQLCSSPWRNKFERGKIWDYPSKTTQE